MNTLDDAHFGQDVYPEPERTSIAAIVGFILSIGGCCFGITSLLGLPLSIFGVVATTKSKGRVGGRGLAIAGTLIGLFTLILWGGCLGASYFGLNGSLQRTSGLSARLFTAIEADDYDAARANLVAPGADSTDAEMLAFTRAYQASLGNFVSIPDSIPEYFGQLFALGPIAQAASVAQTNPSIFPTAATFDAGQAMIIFEFSSPAQEDLISLTIIDLNGDEYTLPMPTGWDSQDSAPDPADTDDTDTDEEP